MVTYEKDLTVYVGSAKPWVFILKDSEGQLIDVSSVTEATFKVVEEIGGSEIIAFSVNDNSLEINSDDPSLTKFICLLEQSDADDLTPGNFIGQFGIRIEGVPVVWWFSEYINVTIKPLAGYIDPTS